MPLLPTVQGCRAAGEGGQQRAHGTPGMSTMPRKPQLKAGAAQGILGAEATQHQTTAGAPLPPRGTVPTCRNTLVPMRWGLAAGPSPEGGTPR